MRILLIEDEKKIASFIARGLKEKRYIVETVFDGEKGLYQAQINCYDLIILDIILPGKDGISVCKELRRGKIDTPILVLTAKDALRDKILGLDSGADDYLTKPFEFEELLARVRSLMRRPRTDRTSVFKVADLELNQLTHKVKRGDKELQLTAKEYALLELLMLHANEIVTRTMISEHVWNEDFDSFTNVIDVYVNFLRNKIDKPFDKQLIHTLHGRGYILRG